MARISIIGAGITGLSVAYHLEQQGFFDYTLYEKELTVGGLCRSIIQDGFTFDYTGHLLHINDDEFRDFIGTITSFQEFNQVNRRSFIYSHDRYTHYPFQMNLWGLPVEVIAECIEGYVQRRGKINPNYTFYRWVMSTFGSGFGNHFFFPYQEKIFDTSVHKFTASWTGRFVPKSSLRDIIAGALSENPHASVGYNAQFLYPQQGGIFFWVERLYRSLKNPVMTGHELDHVDLAARRIGFAGGESKRYEQCVSTIPLEQLLRKTREQDSFPTSSLAKKLRWSRVVSILMGVDKEQLTDKHWIYFPEKKYPFYRLGFPHNFSDKVVPTGCSSLYAEIAYASPERAPAEDSISQARSLIMDLFKLAEENILTERLLTIPHAYVIFDRWRDRHLPELLATLARSALISCGRYGGWKYASMQEGILEGKRIAEQILEQHGYLTGSEATPSRVPRSGVSL